jgi:hypothetical protein
MAISKEMFLRNFRPRTSEGSDVKANCTGLDAHRNCLLALIFPRTRQSRDDKFHSVFARAFCLTTLLYDAAFHLFRREGNGVQSS